MTASRKAAAKRGKTTKGGAAPAKRRVTKASTESVKVYVPGDMTAQSLDAEDVVEAIQSEARKRGTPLELIRNGSRGMFWLEPLMEVEVDGTRIAYGPVQAADIPRLFAADFLHGGAHKLRLGPTEEIPWLKQQQRLTFARVGVVDPVSVADYRAHGGFRGLEAALQLRPEQIVAAVTESGLRGRGGAAFPTGIKWKTCAEAQGTSKFVVCNADEGDSGTFADRLLMEGDPLCLVEGMAIAGLAVGATQGYIYLRSEYPHAERILNAAIAAARAEGWLGTDIRDTGKTFEVEVRMAAGAYICGEETSLLESLEGKRGEVRAKPPLPAIKGLFGKPTVMNNVITFATVPVILERGAAFYAGYGTGRSRGTNTFQLAGNIKHGGLVETAFGISLRELLYDYGGGTASGRPIRAVQVGGPLAAYIPPANFDVKLGYEEFTQVGGMIGHAGIVVFDDTVNMAEQARYAMEFCAIESCGKCTPCRIGSVRGVEVIDRIRSGDNRDADTVLLRDLCQTMIDGSLCALGGMAPLPVLSALDHWQQDFQRPARPARSRTRSHSALKAGG